MRIVTLTAFAVSALIATPAVAQTAADPDNVKAEDVALSPLADVNMRKKEVPPVLEAALEAPYDLTGLKTCKGYATAIASLDAALGDDIDVAEDKSDNEKMGNSAGRIAKSLISGFIPFRSVIREVSGANAQERAWDRALYAGSVRRAFLKGVGQSKGCAYPARSATLADAERLHAARLAMKDQSKARDERTAGAPASGYESRPVVQQVPGQQK